MRSFFKTITMFYAQSKLKRAYDQLFDFYYLKFINQLNFLTLIETNRRNALMSDLN